MIEIEVSAGSARLLQSEVLTAGRVGLRCRLHFDSAWDGLQKTAVLVGSRGVDLFLQGEEFPVPAECLAKAGDSLKIGLYGLNADGSLVIPTVWVNCGQIMAGTSLSGNAEQAVTPNLLAQVQEAAAEALTIAQSVRADADRGAFNGAPGPRGEPGAGITFAADAEVETMLDAIFGAEFDGDSQHY